MNNIEETRRELTMAIEEVSKYESEIKVTDAINLQSVQKINRTVQSLEYQNIVDTLSFIPEDTKFRLKTIVSMDTIKSFDELLSAVAGLVSEELNTVKSWNAQNKC